MYNLICVLIILIKASIVKYFYYFQDPRVLDAMMPYMTHSYGNPHSRTHMYGWESEEAVETARQVFYFLL